MLCMYNTHRLSVLHFSKRGFYLKANSYLFFSSFRPIFAEVFHRGSVWSVMLVTMEQNNNKHSLLLSDLNHHPLSEAMLCKSGSGESSQVCVTLGAGPTWCSWCAPLQLGYPRGKPHPRLHFSFQVFWTFFEKIKYMYSHQEFIWNLLRFFQLFEISVITFIEVF